METVKSIGAWFITLVYFMVILPFFMVLQGLVTPFEIVIYSILVKRFIQPCEYFMGFATNMIEGYEEWLKVLDEEDEEE